MKLPTKRSIPSRIDPKLLVIFSLPKVGKTSLMAGLDNNLIIDMENGADFYNSMSVQAKSVSELSEIAKAIKDDGMPYKYITLDTVSALEDIVLPLAKSLYKETPMGRNYKGEDVRTLPNGAGYMYTRIAFFKIVETFKDLCDTLILLGHVKDKYIEKKPGEEIIAAELDLTGKTKSITSAKSDAIAWLYRKGNQNILSFKTSDTVICGARSNHLKNEEIVVSELKDDGTLDTYWNRVFKELDEKE